ncbi:GH92 family glycosyl hydrolase [Chitinophagaceae bacterium 26-R-25]|nr:GH92 family glycosyl hydrolase [Chitinophagaceae bacterium 26-R-25]
MAIKKIRAITHLLACMVVCNSMQAQDNKPTKIEVKSDLDYIDPTIGNVGQLLQPTRPTVQQPNQMMRMYPVRADHIDDQIASFPLLIVSHRLGMAFSMKPALSLPKTADDWKKKMTFDHDLEITRPWYYSTFLIDNGITVEFAPGKKTGIYRFAFPANARTKCLLLEHYNTGSSSWDLTSDNEIAATETYHGDIKVYMHGSFNAKCKIEKVDETKASVVFGGSANDTIELKYAVSFVSAEQAKRNYEAELDATTFEQLADDAQLAWQKVIGQVKVEGGTTAQKRSFYTALYRCYERMVDITEDGKYYSGFDKKIHATDRPFYVDDWTWDTYLAHHPLRAILNPSMEEDILNSYVNMYEQSGWMPTFPVLFGDHACMNGFHSSVMFLDDVRKGLKNFDVEKAYEGMLKNATQATMLPWRNGPKTELEDVYYAKGFFPALKPGETETVALVNSFEKRQAVAVTLGASYDDWAVSEMAELLGKEKDHSRFAARASNYKTLWNKQQKIFLPKDAQGNWINIDPKFDGGKGGRDYYDENNGWTYMWQVQHDISGLMALMGGKNDFENRLDQLFREPLGRSKSEMWAKFPDATGLVGQYSMGNEPSFHIPYLYNFTSSPWKTQKRVRFLLSTWFKDNIFGIPGDEDGGGMSAFVVFSSLGFYPVTPGIPAYTIGSPLFTKSIIDLQNGKQFTVIANNSSVVNKYIQSAKLNGQTINTPWFTHQQLLDGGKLELEMGPKPNKRWGTGEKAGF